MITSTHSDKPLKGRPPLPADMKRSHVLEVYVNEHELAKVCEQANQRGMQPTVYLRDRGLGLELPRPIDGKSFDTKKVDAVNKLWLLSNKLSRELAPIGSNCNQLAEYAHLNRYQEASVAVMVQELQQLMPELRAITKEAQQILGSLGATDDR